MTEASTPTATLLASAAFVDLLLDAVCVVDRHGRFVFVSAACERILGYTPAELVGRQMLDLVYREDRARTLEAAGKVMGGFEQLHFENRYVRKDGQLVDIMWSARWYEAEQVRIAVARDITAAKRTASIQAATYAISEAAHAAGDVLALIGQVHRIVAGLLPAPGFAVALKPENGADLAFAYRRTEGGQADTLAEGAALALCAEVVRSRQPLLVAPSTLGALEPALAAPGLHHWLGVPLDCDDATIGVLCLQGEKDGPAFADADRDLLAFISTQVATAIQRKQLHEQLTRMAQYDALTGLPNRRLLGDRLDNALARARRQPGRLCVIFIDLNEFKEINDAFGHATGDAVLAEVAARLRRCVRDADTVARMGGDEFVVLLDDLRDPSQAGVVVEKIRQALAPPLPIGRGRDLTMVASVGVANYPEDGDDSEQLLRHADEAMYEEKKRVARRR